MAVTCPIDLDTLKLRQEIQSIYARVATDPTGAFHFHRGPVFAQLVLADEINRATPKTQSALLEAMEERQVTSDGSTLKLPEPFFVIATQNPHHLIGTFPLPESQLDRFLMRIELGYPDNRAERALLKGRDRRDLLNETPRVIEPADLLALQQQTERVHAAEALLDYVQLLIAATRESPSLAVIGPWRARNARCNAGAIRLSMGAGPTADTYGTATAFRRSATASARASGAKRTR